MAEHQPIPSVPRRDPPEPSLSLERVRRALQAGYTQPFLLVDSAIIREKYRCFVAAMPAVRIHYAVKANPHAAVVKVLAEEGAAFEMASRAELDLILAAGGRPEDVLYSNPVKPQRHIEHAVRNGVEWFALDSVDELRKLYAIAPTANLYLRIDVPDLGSVFPLSGKFGAKPDDIEGLLDTAVDLQARLCGVTFHVGSQCHNVDNWRGAIGAAEQVFGQMRAKGLNPRFLNIGGGFPVRHTQPIPSIETIGETVNAALAGLAADIRVMAEPGRFLVSDSACLVCQVIGKAERGGVHWLYLDAGMFGGLFESTQGLEFDLATDREGKPVPWHVAGPTCDADDVLMHDKMLPGDLDVGDFIYVRNAGAYSTTYACEFNGFPLPEVKVI
jgi:ornithine decarboxylase